MGFKSLWSAIGIAGTFLMCLSSPGRTETLPAESVAHHGSVGLPASEWAAALRMLNPAQLEKLKKDPRARDEMARDLLLRRALAERMRQESLTDTALAAKKAIAEDRLLSELYLELAESKGIDEKRLEVLAREEFRTFPERYRKNQLHARHILIMRHASCQSDPAALIESLSARLKAGESFEDLARQYSDDRRSAERGGDLGWVIRGKTVKPFEEALFALREPGDISPPVSTEFGIHLIQLVDRKTAETTQFDDVRQEIVAALRLKMRNELRDRIAGEFKNSAELKLSPEALEKTLNQVSLPTENAR